MSFVLPDKIEIPHWGSRQTPEPVIEDEEEKKTAFGIELARTNLPFQAACTVCGQNTNEALWISKNWTNDPIVLAAKDLYLQTVDNTKTLLDKDQLAAKLLKISEEKHPSSAFYLLDGKDRLAALRLYAEIRGYVGKLALDGTTNFNYNKIVLEFVEPEHKEVKPVIDNSENLNNKLTRLKLVG